MIKRIYVLWSDNKTRPALVNVTHKSTKASIARAAMRYAWYSTRCDLDAIPLRALVDELVRNENDID